MQHLPFREYAERPGLPAPARLDSEQHVSDDVRRHKQQSSCAHYFQERLELEEKVRPVLAMSLRLEYEQLKTASGRKAMLGWNVNIGEQYFNRTRVGKYVSPVAHLRDE